MKDVCVLPVDQVFQPLPLFFVLFQLLLPDLHLLRRHSLQQPSLSHGLGLEEEAESHVVDIIAFGSFQNLCWFTGNQ